MPVSSRSLKHVFALKKQSDIGTAVVDANVDFQRGEIEFAPWQRNRDVSVHDQGFYGKGNFATFNELLHQSYEIASTTRPASDLDLLWMLVYSMGGLASVQPDPVGEPNQWKHTITFADIGTSPEVDYTSFLEQMGDGSTPGHKIKGTGAWVGSCQMTGTFGDFIQASFSGGIRKTATSAAALPAGVTAASLLNINRTKLLLGPSGAPVNIDGAWVGFDITVNQNPEMKLRSGQPVGEEELIERVDRGDQSVTGSITVEFADVKRNFFLNETIAAIEIEMISKTKISGGAGTIPISAKIILPNLVFDAESWSEEGRTSTLELTLAEQSILEVGATQPITIEIITEIDDVEILVA